MNTLAIATPAACPQASILIVDDESNNRKLLELLLQPEGYQTVAAANGEEGLACVAQRAPDLILLDVMMPGIDGYAVANMLKTNPETANIPIIMVTAKTDRSARLAGLKSGAEDFLTKPVDRVELSLRVRNLLRLKSFSDLLSRHWDLEQQVLARTAELERSTELHMTEAARQAAILNALPAHIALLDGVGIIIAVNEVWRRFSGANGLQTANDGLGSSYLDTCSAVSGKNLADAEQAAQVARGIRSELSGDLKHFALEYACHSPIEQRWFKMTVTPLLDEQMGGAIVMHLDITARKQAQDEVVRLNSGLEERVRERTAQLLAANEALEAFSYSVSHDLRTPLSSINGFSALLDKQIKAMRAMPPHASGELAQHYLSRIRRGAVQIGELIDALLSLSRVSRTLLRWDSVDLSAMAGMIIDACREREPGRSVTADIQPALMAHGDPRLLQQVLENLLGNAWKFSAQHPEAHISLSCHIGQEGENVYTVQDNGAGFDMAYYDKLFLAFERLHTAEEFTGTGIGLATVHRIVRRHGGRVWAESVQGRGARFFFTLGKVAS